MAGLPVAPAAGRLARLRSRPGCRLPDAALDADLVELEAFVGQRVRVGGLVVDLRADGFTLDDGTAIGRVILRGGGARTCWR